MPRWRRRFRPRAGIPSRLPWSARDPTVFISISRFTLANALPRALVHRPPKVGENQIRAPALDTMPNRPLTVLIFNQSWARPADWPLPQCPGCQFTADPARIAESDAVVFHVPSIRDWTKIRKYPGQKWVATSMESDVVYPQLRDPAFMARFDLTQTYRLDSEVPVFYFGPAEVQALAAPARPKTAEALAALFVSNVWDAAGRYRYLAELMRHVRVDSFGKVLRNKTLAADRGRQTKLETIANYKFTFAFENSRSRDYVSEKLYDALIAGSVPVYLGAPNVEEFAPADHCYIHAADFKTPRELADYLSLLEADSVRYEAYLAWKNQPLRPRWIELAMTQQGDPLCRLGAKLLELQSTAAAPYVLRPHGKRPSLVLARNSAYARIAAGFARQLERSGVLVRDRDGDGRDGWISVEPRPEGQPSRAALHFAMPDEVKPLRRVLNVNYSMFWATPVPRPLIEHSRQQDLVIVPTEFSRSAWIAGGFPGEFVRVCPPGVDLTRYRPDLKPLPLADAAGREISSYRTRFLSVSEIREQENLPALLKTWIRSTRRGDDAILIVKLTGSSSQRAAGLMYRLHLLERELGTGLKDAAPVVFHDGVILDEQMPRLFAAATHYWSMSHGEGWDASMIEAAACGLRLIAPDHSCYADWLDPRAAALIPARRANAAGMSPDLTWWVPDEQAAEELVAEAIRTGGGPGPALERIVADFSWELAGQRLLAALKDLHLDHGLAFDIAG